MTCDSYEASLRLAQEIMSPTEGHVHRKRRFSAKVRTGCTTCKIRKIKCDEAKPSCLRCTSTGRSCDGYNSATARARMTMQPSYSPAHSDDAERQALYMFRTKIAALMSSTLDVDFWTYDLLQITETYKTVQHAVAAIAMAYQTSILSCRASHAERQLVLTQYNKALNSLRQYLSKTKFRLKCQQIVVLTTTLLFAYLCTLRGSRSEACSHLRNGLALLHEWKLGTPEEKDGAQGTPDAVKFLVTVFTQLDTQARMMIDAIGPHYCKPWSSHHVILDGWGGGHLQSVTRAFTQLERLHNEAVQAMHMLRSAKNTSRYLQTIEECQRQLSMWDSSFGNFLSNVHGTPYTTRALQMRRLLARVSWESVNTAESTALRRNKSWGDDIIDLAMKMIQESGLREGALCFSSAGGLIEGLYFVATRSRDNSTRRRAIDLLKTYPLIEGLWRSTTAARATA